MGDALYPPRQRHWDWGCRLGCPTGILAAAGFVTALVVAAVFAPWGRAIIQPAIGLFLSALVITVAFALQALARGIALTALGVAILILPMFFPGRIGYGFQLVDAIAVTALLVLMLFLGGALHARRRNPDSPGIRWTLLGSCAAVFLLQGAMVLIAAMERPEMMRSLEQTFEGGGPATVIAVLLFGVLNVMMLIFALVAALGKQRARGLATAGLVMAQIMLWSVLGVFLAGVVFQVIGITDATPYGVVRSAAAGDVLVSSAIALGAGLLPFYATAYLCAGAFSLVLCNAAGGVIEQPLPAQPVAPPAEPVEMVPAEPAEPLLTGPQFGQPEAATWLIDEPPRSRQPRPKAASTPAGQLSPLEALRQLKTMLDEGLITAPEYEERKRRILDRM